MLKKVIPGVLIVIGVLAVGVFLFARGDATQASDVQPAPPGITFFNKICSSIRRYLVRGS